MAVECQSTNGVGADESGFVISGRSSEEESSEHGQAEQGAQANNEIGHQQLTVLYENNNGMNVD